MCYTIEDEVHFLINRKLYEPERQRLFLMINEKKQNFQSLNDVKKFTFLLSNPDNQLIVWIGKFIFKPAPSLFTNKGVMYIKYTWPPYIGLISQVRCINPPICPEIEAPAPSSGAAPGVVIPSAPGGLGGDGAGSAVPRCFQCCIQFLSLMLLLFLPLYNTLYVILLMLTPMILVIYHGFTNYVFYAKCFVRNDEIKLWNQSINI